MSIAILSDLYRTLIKPTHDGLMDEFGIPNSLEAACMSIAIKVQESGMTIIRDQNNDNIIGPATGMWQFEKMGGVWEVLNDGKIAPVFRALCDRAGVRPEPDPVWRLFVAAAGDELACAAARLLVWKDPAALPAMVPASAEVAYDYYDRRWRPGAKRKSDWVAKSWPTALAVMATVGNALATLPAQPVSPVPAPPACLEAGTAALASLDRRVTALEEWRHRLMSTV